ncbi:hypothetical protein L0669_16735 [Flavobacterium bizetiae]|uniref:hypothetical protein n=1 Tax=Flavobacterium bizetiae TaxID=2704140 RepID=UPI0021E8F134|nr:hypothetical protein [Flavobacterium bizetiae]UTN02973.1 hypothetical protein L0669_16735 [Flavobacterium bizetiae]
MIIECYKLLKEIEKRPAMWTGEASLKSIKIFVSGYYQALRDNKIVEENIDEPFFDWVANKLGYFESTAGWANMILAYSIGFKPESIIWEEVFDYNVTKEQHLRSIQIFYELVEQFKDELEGNLD